MNEHDDNDTLPADLLAELMTGMAPRLPAPARAAALRAQLMAALKDTPQQDSELTLAIAALGDSGTLRRGGWANRMVATL